MIVYILKGAYTKDICVYCWISEKPFARLDGGKMIDIKIVDSNGQEL
jgi:hypothetical protein